MLEPLGEEAEAGAILVSNSNPSISGSPRSMMAASYEIAAIETRASSARLTAFTAKPRSQR
jgi:hypothetical protein